MDDILNDLRCMLDDRLPHPLEGGKSASDDDNELNEIIVLEKTIALLENNPDQAEVIWETFMNLLDCGSRTDANHWFGYNIERF